MVVQQALFPVFSARSCIYRTASVMGSILGVGVMRGALVEIWGSPGHSPRADGRWWRVPALMA